MASWELLLAALCLAGAWVKSGGVPFSGGVAGVAVRGDVILVDGTPASAPPANVGCLLVSRALAKWGGNLDLRGVADMVDSIRRRWQRVDVAQLKSREKESYNYQKLVAMLADYVFHCMWLTSDWNGPDFLAVHRDGAVLRVQLKGRLALSKKYCGQDLLMAFPVEKQWYMVPHVRLVEIVGRATPALGGRACVEGTVVSWGKPPRRLVAELQEYRI